MNANQITLYGLSANHWDKDYPGGGNYWSDYTDVDIYGGPCQNETGSDGIGDTPRQLTVSDTDHYPLMNRYKKIVGDVNSDGKVDVKDIAVVARLFRSVLRDLR